VHTVKFDYKRRFLSRWIQQAHIPIKHYYDCWSKFYRSLHGGSSTSWARNLPFWGTLHPHSYKMWTIII